MAAIYVMTHLYEGESDAVAQLLSECLLVVNTMHHQILRLQQLRYSQVLFYQVEGLPRQTFIRPTSTNARRNHLLQFVNPVVGVVIGFLFLYVKQPWNNAVDYSEEGIAIFPAGKHPHSRWSNQQVSCVRAGTSW